MGGKHTLSLFWCLGNVREQGGRSVLKIFLAGENKAQKENT